MFALDFCCCYRVQHETVFFLLHCWERQKHHHLHNTRKAQSNGYPAARRLHLSLGFFCVVAAFLQFCKVISRSIYLSICSSIDALWKIIRTEPAARIHDDDSFLLKQMMVRKIESELKRRKSSTRETSFVSSTWIEELLPSTKQQMNSSGVVPKVTVLAFSRHKLIWICIL